MSTTLSLLLRRAEAVSLSSAEGAVVASVHALTTTSILGEGRAARTILSNLRMSVAKDTAILRPILIRHQSTMLPVHAAVISRLAGISLSCGRDSDPGLWDGLAMVEKRRVAATVSSEAARTLIRQLVGSPASLEEWVRTLSLVPDDVFQIFIEKLPTKAVDKYSEFLVTRLHQSPSVFTVAWIRNRVEGGLVSRALAVSALFRHGDTMLLTSATGGDCAFIVKMATSDFSPLLSEAWGSRAAMVCYDVATRRDTSPQELLATIQVLWDLPRCVSLPLLARIVTGALKREDLPIPTKAALITMGVSLTHTVSPY